MLLKNKIVILPKKKKSNYRFLIFLCVIRINININLEAFGRNIKIGRNTISVSQSFSNVFK